MDHPVVPTLEQLCDALRSGLVGSGLVGLGAEANDLYETKNNLPSKQRFVIHIIIV